MLNNMKRVATDDRRTDIILPHRIVYATEGVACPEWILECGDTQTQPGTKKYTELSTYGGKKAAILLDFGTEFFGGIQMITQGIAPIEGVSAKIRFGESANEAYAPLGVKGSSAPHGMRDFDVLIPPNGCNRIGMTGFRFVYIELTQPDTIVRFFALQGVSIYRDIPYRGTFRCSDELLNRIYDTSAYTVHLCMQNLLWDGIKRDRMVWVGDMHPEMLAIRTVFGDNKIVEDSLFDIAKNNPLPCWPNTITNYSMWFLRIICDWYRYSGNRTFVEELSYYWKALLEQLLPLVHEGEEEKLPEDELDRGYFIDWPSKTHPEAKAGTYALWVQGLYDASKLCEMIGEDALAEVCAGKAKALQDIDFELGEMKQITAMRWLAGMADKENVAHSLTKGGGQGMSTFMSYYILRAVGQTSDMKTALDMLREYYGGMLKVGATTFWEDFDLDWIREGASIENLWKNDEYDIHGDNGRYCYEGFRHSLCHGWSSGPSAFLAEEVLGCQIVEDGCKTLVIKPNLGDLEWAEGTYPTPYGDVFISAKKQDGETVVSVEAPKEITIKMEQKQQEELE